MKSECLTIAAASILALPLIMGAVASGFLETESDQVISSAEVVHEGNLTIANNEVFVIDGCDFHQNGSILVEDYAMLLVRNAQLYQMANNNEHIMVRDHAAVTFENSSVFFSRAFDVKISITNEAMLNITGSSLNNSLGGLWIWMEEEAALFMRDSNLSSYGDGARVVTDHRCRAEIEDSSIDFVVCWDRSIANIRDSTVRKGAKAWSTSQIQISNCAVDYLWAYQDCRMEVRDTIIPSYAPYETALRSSDNADVCFFSSLLWDDVNVAASARVRLRNCAVRNVSAYDNAIVWLVNTTADGTHKENQAEIYNFTSIQDAIDQASEGDRVLIPLGAYRESIVINKALSVIGEGSSTTSIDGGHANAVVAVAARNVLIEGFLIQNGETGVSVDATSNCTVRNCRVTNNTNAVTLYACQNCTIIHNEIDTNDQGIHLQESANSTAAWNDFYGNSLSVQLNLSSSNVFHHNNFINDSDQVLAVDSASNAFDDGFEGNYWSCHLGTDSNHDGIGDSGFPFDENITDEYPLEGRVASFAALNCTAVVISNSTIERFEHFQSNNTIRLLISNSTLDQSFGFCRVAVPHGLVDEDSIAVVIDQGLTPVLFFNSSLVRNGTHTWIYFAYEQSTHAVEIVSEFPLRIALSAFMTLSSVVLALSRRRGRKPAL